MYNGILPIYPNWSVSDSIAVASQSTRRQPLPNYELPPFISILNILYRNTPDNGVDKPLPKNFITDLSVLNDAAFSPKCPILGAGHHFTVYASPFDTCDRDFSVMDGRAINNQVYCLKIANFNSPANIGASDDFRKDYCHTLLQELRVLLHPEIRKSENIISLFGLDFHEDYNDYTVAWPVLIMEYAEYGTFDTLQEDVEVNSELARTLLLDVARGIHALHKCNIIHGDVKSENVVICRHHQRKYVARIADFGLSMINPSSEIENHRLPGGTPLWSAPEYTQPLTVQGLRQTDVYSFGLMVWRVLVKHACPYELIPPEALALHRSAGLEEVLSRAKSNSFFHHLILETIRHVGLPASYTRQVIEATVSINPMARDLARVISVLTDGQQQVVPRSDENRAFWETEKPSLVMRQLVSHFPDRFIHLTLKGSILYCLRTSLEAVFESGSEELVQLAGWILFQLAASPPFPTFNKDVDECCRILRSLCTFNSFLGIAVAVEYHRIHGKETQFLDESLLMRIASEGSYHAIRVLKDLYPMSFEELMQKPLAFERRPGTDADIHEAAEAAASEEEAGNHVAKHCRRGDFDGCKLALENGDSACPSEDGVPSALHWLVSFSEESEITQLLKLMLENGAVIDAWEGDEDKEEDYQLGRVVGTPLHWAIWYRNIHLVRALTKIDSNPRKKNVDRAIEIAATMHFYDILEVLREWTLRTRHQNRSYYNWNYCLLRAATNHDLWLPRILRHGKTNLQDSFDKTMNVITSVIRPSTEEMQVMFNSSVIYNYPALLQYLFDRLELGKYKNILSSAIGYFRSIAMGGKEIFEIYITQGLITPNTLVGDDKFTILQTCIIFRQRNLYFLARLLAIGCSVDGTGKTMPSRSTPFAIAVSLGLYDHAIMLLENGADKDILCGWGYTVTMNLFISWRDVPISRLKFLFEDVPRLGFGHVSFYGWPRMKGNLLYGLSMNTWASYTAGCRLGETAKYILSRIADKSCLNQPDRIGGTALRMACLSGNIEIVEALIEAGHDINTGIGITPLCTAREWLEKCQKRYEIAKRDGPGAERRLTATLCSRAERCVKLLTSHGGFERSQIETSLHIAGNVVNGWKITDISMETLFEIVGFGLGGASQTMPGAMRLNPTSKDHFKAHHGQKGFLQNAFKKIGKQLDTFRGGEEQRVATRWQAHNCWPWINDYCVAQGHHATFPQPQARITESPVPTGPGNTRSLFSSSNTTYSPSSTPGPSSPSPSAHPQHSFPPRPLAPYHTETHIFEEENKPPPPPRRQTQTPSKAIENINNALFSYFLDSPESSHSTTSQRRAKALLILTNQLATPIRLDAPRDNIGECVEFYNVKGAVETSLEAMGVQDVWLVPEIIEREGGDGGEMLIIHVCGT